MPDSDFQLEDPTILGDGLAPEEAIRFWAERANLTWDQAKELSDAARARAFYATGLYEQDLVDRVSEALKDALANGETLEDFQKRVAEVITKQGWKDYRVETIFRTNLQTAYSAGRYLKMQEVKKARPYWQYLAIMDKRTRPSHAVLHEKVYPADHEFWDSNYPPNGFRCRCAVRTLSQRQVDSEGLSVEREMPKPQHWTDPKTNKTYYVQFPGAEKGFANNPAKEWLKNGGVDALPPLRGAASSILAKIDEEAAKVNPDYATDPACQRNCQRCVLAYELRRRGCNVEATPNSNPDWNGTSRRLIMNGSEAFIKAQVYGKDRLGGKTLTKKDLERSLNLLPDGARAAIFWRNPSAKSGHIIVCEKVDGNLQFIDPQTGTRGRKNLRVCDPLIGYYWYRMDNLQINRNFEWNEVVKNARS